MVAEISNETGWRAHINAPLDYLGQLQLHAGQRHESGQMARLELDEEIDVAVRAEIIARDRAEQRQLADVIATAEIGNCLVIDRNLDGHASDYPFRGTAHLIRTESRPSG